MEASKLDCLRASHSHHLPLTGPPPKHPSSSSSSLSGTSSSCGGGSDGDIFQKINAILDNKLDLGNFLVRQDGGHASGGSNGHAHHQPVDLGLGRSSTSSLSPNSSVFYPSASMATSLGFSASRENCAANLNLFGLNNLANAGSQPGHGGPVKTLQCGDFKFPDVSSPLSKILARNNRGGSRTGSNSDPDSPLGLQHAFGGLGSPSSNYYRNSGYSSDGSNGMGGAQGGNNSVFEDSIAGTGVNKSNDLSQSQHRSESPQSESGYGSYGSISAAVAGGAISSDESLNDLLRSLSIGDQNSPGGRHPPTSPSDGMGRYIYGGGMPPPYDFDGSAARNAAVMQNFHHLNRLTNGGSGGPSASLRPFPNYQQGQSSFSRAVMPVELANGEATTLEKAAKQHRNGTALYDASCTWSGQLPPRNMRNSVLSCKVFLGGVPWDITETSLINTFKTFGPIRIEWPGKENTSIPKGYLYVIFETEKQVKALLSACTHDYGSGGSWYFKISSRRMRNKEVQVIPWVISDSNHVRVASSRLDPQKTVFVGALHGMLTAEGLCNIFNDLFGGVVYAGVDTDKFKYPIGSGRVTFNNNRSYMKAVAAAFIEIKTTKFTKKVQVDPYLEDALCSACGLRQGPYFCREASCFNYFCRNCWEMHHAGDLLRGAHKPLMRNSKGAANAAAATGGGFGLGGLYRPPLGSQGSPQRGHHINGNHQAVANAAAAAAIAAANASQHHHGLASFE